MTTSIVPGEQLGETLGTAVFLANYESNSQEWLDLRKTGIGGSDVGAIIGVSPWTSPFALWAKKLNLIPDDFAPSEAMEWGNRLEPVVLDAFAEQNSGLTIYRNVGTWAHKDRPWQLANPDAIALDRETGEFMIIEVKTSRYEDDWNEKTGQIPLTYRAQVLWYMDTFGFTSAKVVTLFSGSKLRVFDVQADDFEVKTNLEAVERFVGLVQSETKPEFDGAMSTYEAIRQIHPDIDPDGEVELGDLGMHYELAVSKFAEAEKHLNEMKSRVLDAMGSAKRGLIFDEWKLTRQARNGGTPYLVAKRG